MSKTECHLLMHTACMSGNMFLWFMSQHDGFLDAECWGRNRMIDKFWGQKTDKPLHFSVELHNLWKVIKGKSRHTSHLHSNDETMSWKEHVIYSYITASKEKERLSNVTTFTKIACKPNLLHNVKECMKEGGFDQIFKRVTPECLYLLDCENPEHFQKIVERANRLRPYGELKNKLLLEDNLEGQRELTELLKTYCSVCTVDIGKLMFDYDDGEYNKVAKALNSKPLRNWKELIKDKMDVYDG